MFKGEETNFTALVDLVCSETSQGFGEPHPDTASHLKRKLTELQHARDGVFDDVLPELVDLRNVRIEFEQWAKSYPADYVQVLCNTTLAMASPRLL